jgi:hypothetical protein
MSNIVYEPQRVIQRRGYLSGTETDIMKFWQIYPGGSRNGITRVQERAFE